MTFVQSQPMKLVMTLLARDEADILDAQLSYHLSAGVDFVIAIDNDSQDGTTDILKSYARQGYLHLIRERGDLVANASEWRSRMARLAACEFEADWVMNSDADEFWWPRGGDLKSFLGAVPARFGKVRALVRSFAPRPDDGVFFAERMTARVVYAELPKSSPLDSQPFHVQEKVFHRAHPGVQVKAGAHDASWTGLVDFRGWWPFEVLHFPIRSHEQCTRKWRNWQRQGYTGAYDILRDYESLLVDDKALAEGLADGSLLIDTRVRDALRRLRPTSRPRSDQDREFALPSNDTRLTFPRATLEEQAGLAADVAHASSRDSFAKAARRAGQLEARIAELERRSWRRHGRRARRLAAHILTRL